MSPRVDKGQLDFDALLATEKAVARVQEPDDAQAWLALSLPKVKRLAERLEEFTSDDLWPLLTKPREPRALGPLMRAARDAGWIEATDRVKRSKRKERHTGTVAVWRSRIHGA